MKQFFCLGHKWSKDDVSFFKKHHNITFANDYWVRIPDTLYQEVYSYLGERWNACMHAIKYVYSKEDICSSDYCVLDVYFACGMPLWKDTKYDDPAICAKCNYTTEQKYDYHLKKVSKHQLWGFSAWVHDALFTSIDLYKTIFAPLGIQSRKVLSPNGALINNVVQLIIPITNEPLQLPLQEYNICPECGQKKYLYRNLYPFHPLQPHPLPHLFLSKEVYGEGWESDHKIFISTKLALKLIEMKELKYEWLIPCVKHYDFEFDFATIWKFMHHYD